MQKINWQIFVRVSMFFGFLSFIIGSLSGIARGGGLELGFINKLSFFHQYFMIGGFFGPLITAERIVSLRNEKLNFLIITDIALINLRKTEPFRFTAYCILAGYIWLAIYGLSFINTKHKLRFENSFFAFGVRIQHGFCSRKNDTPIYLKDNYKIPQNP
jgi:hypothetical protein